jgi:small subunit ribosomal protein S8
MSINDPIADMLTRIRNANAVKRQDVLVRETKVCRQIADVLKSEGYIGEFETVADGPRKFIKITLKYGPKRERVIQTIQRESRVGCRVYKGVTELPRPMGGLGIAVVSTSRGVMSDRQCRQAKVGGELLCTVS